jgi:hypothetical protein
MVSINVPLGAKQTFQENPDIADFWLQDISHLP